MIFDAIVGVLLSLVTGLLGLVPAFQLPNSMMSFGANVGTRAAALDDILPITAIGVCFVILIGVRLFIGAFQLIVFVWELIPFKAT